MWARLCFCGKVARSSLFKTAQTLPRTFSSLNCFSKNLTRQWKPIQLLRKNQCRIKSTIALDEKASQTVQWIHRKRVCFWLLACCGMVHVAINIGGYTRLTESGLSMVTWRFTFEQIPGTEEEWAAEFAKYQQFPEFKQLKKDLTLEEFKKIFVVEFFHRFWGRAVGLMFFVPAGGFWFRGWLNPVLKKRLVFFGSLILAQGFLGWYMVQSGLEDRFKEQSEVPRVSQYRLAAHLGLALTLYVGFLWSALDLLLQPQTMPALTVGFKRLTRMAGCCKSLVFLTAISGAFVAGLDAGLIYNSFPKMGDSWVPKEILDLSPVWRNFTENPTTVQFDHRIMGITTFTAAIATWLLARREKLPPRAKIAANILAIFACVQAALGISTVVHNVPNSLALTHQSGAVALLATATWLVHELSRMRFIPK